MGDRLKARNIIVTGAGSGIGAGIAADLAENGANVVVADINFENGGKVADRIAKAGGKAVAVAVDVSNRESIKKMIAKTVESFGSLDVMFNNAGIIQTASYLEITEADWKRLMDVNGLGVLMGTQEAAKQMIAQGKGGKIVNTASIGAKQGYPQFAHYCASKFAVAALTQAAARAFAEHRITVNCFGPGVVHTALWDQLNREFMEKGITSKPDQAINDFSTDILIGRYSTPRDIVGVTTFLASSDSDYITGQTVMVDGGMVLI
ncbi:meso-butanediol dehydrogenase / (S,S)-butanediol dehydrogenase / diacetyl reductase [Bradyrhizobium erythrophlei]|jgi:meso-butanediol dehydrogenase/(S,S)-butanediol dehydrogenase/diacetyl reductase|nr:meso-butanediol dehydrogenase / (S,S)-butanediol dehydrogenase / diacetyl reductase [Bradyrhizobium erythrophlei]